ncbi:unnamed protein product, partial [Rotaria magnacalcarata]
GSSSSSLCSTPNDRSLARAFLDINSMLVAVGLGRRVPTQDDQSSIRPVQHSSLVLHSSNETITIRHPTKANTPLAETTQANGFLNVDYRVEPFISPIRPNSLVLSASQSSSQKTQILRPPSIETQHMTDDETEKYYSAQSSKISTPMINSMDSATYKANFEDKLKLSSILDIDKTYRRTRASYVTKIFTVLFKKHISFNDIILQTDRSTIFVDLQSLVCQSLGDWTSLVESNDDIKAKQRQSILRQLYELFICVYYKSTSVQPINKRLLTRYCTANEKDSKIKQILWLFIKNFIEPKKEVELLKSICRTKILLNLQSIDKRCTTSDLGISKDLEHYLLFFTMS